MNASCIQIQGYDSFAPKLGDVMRGERATLGKSIEDAGHDLKIDAQVIEAIENCDHTVFPNRNVVAGYVRSYARYLRLDPDRCYRLFCEESGFKSPSAGGRTASRVGVSSGGDGDEEESESRFAAMSAATRPTSPPVSLGAILSSTALVATLAVLGYAGYSVLQNFQRVDFAPAIHASGVNIEAPEATTLIADGIHSTPETTDYADYRESGVEIPTSLNAIPNTGRDGPISEIDPGNYGAFAANGEFPVNGVTVAGATNDPIVSEAGVSGKPTTIAKDTALADVAVYAVREAWVQIINDSDVILFQGVLRAGQTYEVPVSVISPIINVGDAGGVYIRIGDKLYGPAGKSGQVIKGLPLTAETIRAKFPNADDLEDEKSVAIPAAHHIAAIVQ